MLNKDCHEEAINRCGHIQSFGFLFVFDNSNVCIAASENCQGLLNTSLSKLIGMPLLNILEQISEEVNWELSEIQAKINDRIYHRYVERISNRDTNYFVSLYRFDQRIYLELECCNQNSIKSTNLFYYNKYLAANCSDVWQALTVLIQQIIGFDRVMVYRFHEDSSGQVIAESKTEGMSSLLGYRYPEFDIPQQARELYTTFLARHVADVDIPSVVVHGIQPEELDLTRCGLRALSPLHLQYLRNAGAGASASFSIIVDGKLWGLVACQNTQPRNVDLEQRHLSVFLTQCAVNNYLLELQRESLDAQKLSSAIEHELKAKLLVSNDTVFVLEQFAEQIMSMASADGLIIKHDRGQAIWGKVPGGSGLEEIARFLDTYEDKQVFFTSSFIYKNESMNALDNYPGVLRLNVLPHNNLKIYLFRTEYIYEEVWAGKPEKIIVKDTEKSITFSCPRKSFEAWHEMMRGQSIKWNEYEVSFMEKIAHTVQQAIAQRGGEIDQLNRELIRSNNALETFGYTLTHDLKNPLSAIKLAGQMIDKDGLPKEMISKLASNILEATSVITDMLEKVYELNKGSHVTLKREHINPRSKILSIAESCKQQFESYNLEFEMGETLPILGERTLIYQLFLNLIGNAIKYSSKKEKPSVKVYSTMVDNSVYYYINDNGIGMDLANNPNIFDIFKRLPNSSEFEGSGIGLSIVKRIVDQLDARITVDSKLGEGTTFQVEFIH